MPGAAMASGKGAGGLHLKIQDAAFVRLGIGCDSWGITAMTMSVADIDVDVQPLTCMQYEFNYSSIAGEAHGLCSGRACSLSSAPIGRSALQVAGGDICDMYGMHRNSDCYNTTQAKHLTE